VTDTGSLVIVGAGQNLGAAAARRFFSGGARIGLIARSPEGLDDLQKTLNADGVPSASAAADVTDGVALRTALTSLTDELGEVDTLLFSPRPNTAWIKPVLDTTSDDIAAAIELNVVAAARAVQAVLGRMRERGAGALLFTTGGAALEPHRDRAVSGIAYAAESVWVRMLHESLSPQGIYAAQLTVVGGIGANQQHHPDAVAEQLWQMRCNRSQPLVVMR
jgi:NADP-dependent 3-hydroxy acid dehydrogenase YdfG